MRFATLAAAVLTVPVLAACTQNASTPTADEAGDPRAVTVTSTDDACEVSTTEVPAGTVTFTVTNTGSAATEFYLLAADGKQIAGEVENIGPDLDRQLVVQAEAGKYFTACKPGMKGDGIRADFTVTGSAEGTADTADAQALLDQAEGSYADYVQAESDQLVTRTRTFVTAYKAGDDDRARAIYPDARSHWERIETVAESFGDLDPKLDAREADLEPGQRWTGWHLMEKDLWPALGQDYTPLTTKQRRAYAADLLANTRTLDRRIGSLDFTVDQIANGSRGLLEEVAKGKVTGEEEYWSRTDLWDFQANIDGARVGYEGVRPILDFKEPELAEALDVRFEELQALLDAQRVGDGFRTYDQLGTDEVKGLADAVNALAEPLSRLTAAVLG